MRKRVVYIMLIGVLTVCCATMTACNKDREYSVPRESLFVDVNGVNIHYEVCGTGQPFILLHGNGEDLSIFDGLVDRLSADYTVYAIDTRGHGQSQDVTEFHYADMAEDVACFINELNLNKPLLYGFSDGGIIGLELAIKYPDLLDKLMVSGANVTPDGLKGYFVFGCKVSRLFAKKAEKGRYDLMFDEPNISAEDLHKISVPTYVLAGSNDIVKEEQTKFIANNISDSTLKIVKKANHGNYVKDGAKIYGLLMEFLKK